MDHTHIWRDKTPAATTMIVDYYSEENLAYKQIKAIINLKKA